MDDIKVIANGITMIISLDEYGINIKPVTNISTLKHYSFGIRKNKFTADYLVQKIDDISKNIKGILK